MRKYLPIAILVAGMLSSCGKEKPPPPPPPPPADSKVAFTVTGEGFEDYRFQFNDNTAQEVAAYEPASGLLQPIMKGGTKDGKYQVEINGQWEINSEKTITFNDKNIMDITIDPGDTAPSVTLTSKINEGTITITKFGMVGENIEGTFKGKFTSSGGGIVDVKDGKFTLKREEDL